MGPNPGVRDLTPHHHPSPPSHSLPLTLPAGSALDGDDGRLSEPFGAAAGGPQLARAGVGDGVAPANRLAAGAQAAPGGRPFADGGRSRHAAGGYDALKPLTARRSPPAAGPAAGFALLSPTDAATTAGVQHGTAGAGGGQRRAAGPLAALRAGGRRGGCGGGGQQCRQQQAPAPQRHGGGEREAEAR